MAIPRHSMTLFEKPKLGNAYINRYPISHYKHKINAIGGYDAASCDVAIGSRGEGQRFLEQFIGNRVAFFDTNPFVPFWEGYINRMSFVWNGVQYTISLDDMANRLTVTYTNNAGGITTPSAANNTASQAFFGIKHDRLELRAQNTGTTMLTVIMNTILNQRAWPKASALPGQGAPGSVHIECLGFFHTLEWDPYQDATVADVTLSNYLTTLLLPAVINGTTFFNNADTSGVVTNATTIQRTSIRGETIWDRMRVLQEVGDGSNYWVMGISPTNPNTHLRNFYFRSFNPALNYTAKQADGFIIRDQTGQQVNPWLVQPDNGVKLTDMMVGAKTVGDEPTETWIMTVDYDADRQRVIWRGDDDKTAEGAFQYRRQSKAFNKRFGAQYRV